MVMGKGRLPPVVWLWCLLPANLVSHLERGPAFVGFALCLFLGSAAVLSQGYGAIRAQLLAALSLTLL